MAYYLVEAAAKEERLPELGERLEKDEFLSMRPFGVSVTFSLRGARRRPDGGVVWEEEDYCSPPLAQERAAVLDEYFDAVRVTSVEKNEGWAQIRDLPPLFPELADYRVEAFLPISLRAHGRGPRPKLTRPRPKPTR